MDPARRGESVLAEGSRQISRFSAGISGKTVRGLATVWQQFFGKPGALWVRFRQQRGEALPPPVPEQAPPLEEAPPAAWFDQSDPPGPPQTPPKEE